MTSVQYFCSCLTKQHNLVYLPVGYPLFYKTVCKCTIWCCRNRVIAMFHHAYDGYLRYAYPYDELRPLTCDGHDTWGRYDGFVHVLLVVLFASPSPSLLDAFGVSNSVPTAPRFSGPPQHKILATPVVILLSSNDFGQAVNTHVSLPASNFFLVLTEGQ